MPKEKRAIGVKVKDESGDDFHAFAEHLVAPSDDWLQENFEGQLSVDVIQTQDAIIIRSAIAGVVPEDVQVTVNGDLVAIKGIRHQEDLPQGDFIYQECYWGGFSRSIILPVTLKARELSIDGLAPDGQTRKYLMGDELIAAARLRNGILTLILPKAIKQEMRVVEETE